jgi:pyruvate,water dikinase
LDETATFFVTLDELLHWRPEMRGELDRRVREYAEDCQINLPEVIMGTDISLAEPHTMTAVRHFRGLALSAGVARGELKRIETEAALSDKSGKIMYFPDASPKYSHLYGRAKGIIVGSGGMGSHGAILAREYQIPAVSLGGSLFKVTDGHTVSVDGNEGTVSVEK